MPHNEVGFNNLTFEDNLANVNIDGAPDSFQQPDTSYVVIREISDGTGHQAKVGMEGDTGSSAALVDDFFDDFSRTGTRLPASWDKLMEAFRAKTGNTTDGPQAGTAFDAFVTEFRDILGIGGGATAAVGGDWAALSSVVDADRLKEMFVQSFTHFLQSYPYDTEAPNQNGTINTSDFFNNWYKYMAQTSSINIGSSDLASYRQIYDAFGFPAADFNNRLIQFYSEEVEETRTNFEPDPPNGFFLPSQSFGRWFEQMQVDYSISLSGTGSPAFTSVTTASSKRVIILDRIFRLLVLLIEVLQKVAAAQASRLSFLTQWQKGYVDAMNQIRTLSANDGSEVDDNDAESTEAKIRQDLNRVNSTYTEQLRANRSLISDDAKALQSNVNQSNDSVTQQSNLATSIIQQFSTILGSIFR